MGTKIIKTGERVATGPTDEYIFGEKVLTGEIVKVELYGNASFKVYTLHDDDTIDEYIYGSSTTPISVATSTHLYPGRKLTDRSGAIIKETNVPFTVSRCRTKIEVSGLNVGDKWSADVALKR